MIPVTSALRHSVCCSYWGCIHLFRDHASPRVQLLHLLPLGWWQQTVVSEATGLCGGPHSTCCEVQQWHWTKVCVLTTRHNRVLVLACSLVCIALVVASNSYLRPIRITLICIYPSDCKGCLIYELYCRASCSKAIHITLLLHVAINYCCT